MADHSFTEMYFRVLNESGLTSSFHGKLPAEDVQHDRGIVSLHIHMERAIGHIESLYYFPI